MKGTENPKTLHLSFGAPGHRLLFSAHERRECVPSAPSQHHTARTLNPSAGTMKRRDLLHIAGRTVPCESGYQSLFTQIKSAEVHGPSQAVLCPWQNILALFDTCQPCGTHCTSVISLIYKQLCAPPFYQKETRHAEGEPLSGCTGLAHGEAQFPPVLIRCGVCVLSPSLHAPQLEGTRLCLIKNKKVQPLLPKVCHRPPVITDGHTKVLESESQALQGI